MRVAQILYSGLGGHGGVAFGLIDGDVEGELQWTLGFYGIEPLLDAYAQRCARQGLPCHYLPAVAGAPWRAWPRILGWLRAEQPDAIILHSPTAVLPCALYARLRRIPLLVVEHQQNRLKRWGDWAATRSAMRWANRLIVLTEDYAEGVAERLGRRYRGDKVRIIPNGLDLDLFRPAPAPSSDVIRIGMAARFTPIKRFDLLVGAIAELRTRQPDRRYHFSLAGEGETWTATREAAQRCGVADHVSFEGMLPETDLAEWYRGLHIYAHASRGEALSLSLLQAMASAVPIVASDVAGIGPLLGKFEGAGASLVAEPSAAAFATAIAQIGDRYDAAKHQAQALRDECVRHYGGRTMFLRYKAAIQDALT